MEPLTLSIQLLAFLLVVESVLGRLFSPPDEMEPIRIGPNQTQ